MVSGLLVGAVIAALVVALVSRDSDDSATSSTRGSGVPATEARELPAFTALDLAGTNAVTVQVGSPQSVRVTADNNLLDKVTTTVRSGALVVGEVGSWSTKSSMKVDVTIPSLDRVTLTGTGTITVTGVSARDFTAELNGTGTVVAAGSADRLTAVLSDSGTLALSGLVARDVTARLEGTGTIRVTATSSLDADLRGTGAIVYSGNPPTVTRSIAGTGAITAG
jgi:hypothetical protein